MIDKEEGKEGRGGERVDKEGRGGRRSGEKKEGWKEDE